MIDTGDIVKIREDLEVNKSYGIEDVVPAMKKYFGKKCRVVEIKQRLNGSLYILDGASRWHWTEEMLEEVDRE